ncbi:hypothetical protein D9613_009676 [Agrocybe pediades]|uniref:Uncharacterized protein n=1 Tax=Agrocybe pediades TaxID=84607 RepID=A0A8H4VSZ1_9AGAR|nr:hypothetical protein D9613_009676 [Agrocybe pediades]
MATSHSAAQLPFGLSLLTTIVSGGGGDANGNGAAAWFNLDLNAPSKSGTPFGQLLLAVFNSILQVFLLCAAGYILAKQGVLDKKTQKQINRLNVNLFTPALLFSKVAFYLTPAKLKELWIIPIWFVIVTFASMFVGRGLGWLAGLRRSQRSFITAAAMFMNSNTLPIALMQSLVVSVPDLAWDALADGGGGTDGNKDSGGDNKNAMLGRALTYLTMYSVFFLDLPVFGSDGYDNEGLSPFGSVRYSYGVSLLSKADTVLVPANDEPGSSTPSTASFPTNPSKRILEENANEQTPLLLSSEHQDHEGSEHEWTSYPSTSTLVHEHHQHHHETHENAVPPIIGLPGPSPEASRHEGSLVGSPKALGAGALPPALQEAVSNSTSFVRTKPRKRSTTFYNSFPNSPNDSRVDLTASVVMEEESGGSSSGDEESRLGGRGEEESLPTHHQHQHHKAKPSFFKRVWVSARKRTYRAMVAVQNFMTVPLYASLLSLIVACSPPLKHGLEHHMQPVNDALSQAGKCAVPLTLVVLGGYFYTPPEESDAAPPTSSSSPTKLSTRKKKDKRSYATRIKEWYVFWKEERARRKEREAKDPKRRPGETKTIVLAVLARMVITPVLLLPIMVWATKSDWHVVFDE